MPLLDVFTLQSSVLHMHVYTPQGPRAAHGSEKEPELLLDVAAPQGPELHRDVSTLESCAAPGRVFSTGP
jgi:hypothetical protein